MASQPTRIPSIVYFNRATKYFENNDYPNAEINFFLALRLGDLAEPFMSEACNYIGYIKLDSGNYLDAVRYYNRALSSGLLDHAQTVCAKYHRGMANNKLGNYQTVISDLTFAINSGILHPYELGLAYIARGMLRCDHGQYIQAVSDLTLSIDNHLVSSEMEGEARHCRAKSRFELKQYKEALEDISFIIHSDLPEIYLNAVQNILSKFPRDVVLDCFTTGVQRLQAGNYLQAEAYFTAVIFYLDIPEETRALALINRCEVRLKLGKPEPAGVDITGCIDVNLVSPETRAALEKYITIPVSDAVTATEDSTPSCRPG